MIQKKFKQGERFIWIGITFFLLILILFVSFSNRILAQNQTLETQRALEKFTDILYYVQEYYVNEDKLEPNNLIDGALNGLFEALDDPYSSYLTSYDLRSLKDTSTGKFGGVGLVISKKRDSVDDKGNRMENVPIEVITPIQGTPAYKAGVSAGDLIIKVDGQSTYKLTLDEVVIILRGRVGTQVTMTIQRGESLIFDVTVTRENIEIPTVKSALIPGNIGYLKIIEFTKYTPQRVKEVILDFKSQNYNALIIDLRFNPGGVLNAVVDITDYILSSGPIVSVKGRAAAENAIYQASRYKTIVNEKIPIVVLINKGSASASEILAGALKDTRRATIIGETSYGKGTVQHARVIGDSGFRLTVAKYYTPAEISIDGIGIDPHIIVKEEEFTEEELSSYERLIKENTISLFVKANPSPTEEEITQFIKKLKQEGIILREIALRRLIKSEINRTNNNPPIYDLETDLVLKRAVDFLKANE